MSDQKKQNHHMSLESFLDHLRLCDLAIIDPPTPHGDVHCAAIVSDTLYRLGCGRLNRQEADRVCKLCEQSMQAGRLIQLACWVYHHDALCDGRYERQKVLDLAWGPLAELAAIVAVENFIEHADRREELVRRCLAAIGEHPADEDAIYAATRLKALDSIELNRVVRDTQAAKKRAEAVRRAMAERAARAAPTYGRE